MLALDAFRREYFDVRFRTRLGARARVVERPGLWMSDAEQRAIVEDIRTVVVAGVGPGGLDYGVLADPERLKRAIVTLIYDGDRPVAFNALHILDCELHGRSEEVLHLGLVMVHPSYWNKGLTGALYGITVFLVSARRQMRPLWVSNVTQVPLVFGLVGDWLEDPFPAVRPGARRSFAHLHLARQISAQHRSAFGTGPEAEFDEDRFVFRNAYTGGSDNLKKTYDEAPKHRDEAANRMCREMLDYARGDDFLQIGRATFGSARRYLTRAQTAVSPGAVFVRGGMLLAESIVAPVLQWLTPDRATGELRAANEPDATS